MGIDADFAFEPVSKLGSGATDTSEIADTLGLKSGLFWFVPVLVNLIKTILLVIAFRSMSDDRHFSSKVKTKH